MNIYEELMKGMGDLRKAGDGEFSGIDDFLTTHNRVKVASLGDLSSFFRISSDTLVHKAKKDLWRIVEGEDGEVMIERLFDPNTNEAIRI